MATIIGTAANDVLAGTTLADRIEGGDGNDRINGGAGDDDIFGGRGADILTGDAGNDRIYAEDGNDGVYGGGGDDFVDGGVGDDILFGDGGNDTLIGGDGNDRISGGIGNDIIDGGTGNDTLNGDAGDDTFIWRPGDGNDTIIGGSGNDRLELRLEAGDITSALRADLAAYKAWAAAQVASAGSSANLASQTTGGTFTFASLGLTISVLEGVAVKVGGQDVAIDTLLNTAPVAVASVQLAAVEDSAVEGVITATDGEGDALTFGVATGPSKGAITLDAATGAFVYTPVADFSGTDSFVVRITDANGASVTQTVQVSVAAQADAPSLSGADITVGLAAPVTGTESGDVLTGNTAPESATVELGLAAALSDLDGSETLSVSIAGVPASAELSAGVKQPDGTWLLTSADLPGLTMTSPVDAEIALVVTATASEATGGTASVSMQVTVSFDHTGMDDDVMHGAGGDDVIDGRTGNDVLDGGAGDDLFIQRAGDGTDTISGGEGYDTVRLELTSVDVTPSFLTDLANYQTWTEAGATGAFTFASLGLTIDTTENLEVVVDGQDVSVAELLNVAPTAACVVAFSTDEDVALTGSIKASDANGDVLTFTIEQGPASGSVTLDRETGEFVYSPGQNKSGDDSFSVRVTDAFGASVVQTVNVGVTQKADAPVLSANDMTVSIGRVTTVSGTRGNDVLRGDQYMANATIALVIAAALTDMDGSESLAVRIGGMPSGATLSAGTLQSDGTWLLQPADLNGLTMTAPTARDISLQVTAIARDGASIAESSDTMNITFQRGGNMNDTIVASAGTDTYDGGLGTDTVDYSTTTSAVTLDMGTGKASGPGSHTLTSVENIVGTSFDDNITGDAGNNVITAGAGNDRVNGGGGDDTFIDGLGDDRYDGGTGFDVLDFSSATRAISVDDGRVTGMGSDRYSNVEKIVGSSFADTFSGGKDVDIFDGGAGNDSFRGFEGSDVFTGGAGSDTFIWKEKDIVSGKKSQGVDTVTDFGAGDRLDLSDITDGFLGLNNLLGVNPTTLVKVTDTSAGSMVSVKVGSVFYDVVLLQNVHGVTTSSLLADGQLIA